MSTRARGVRLPEQLEEEVQREMERTGRSWSEVVRSLVDEAVKMRRAPGIVFTGGPTGRRATIAGTGIDVWELVAAWKACGEDYACLEDSYPWLEDRQLRAALSYYELFPEEIDSRLAREDELTPERVWKEMPFAKPPQER